MRRKRNTKELSI